MKLFAIACRVKNLNGEWVERTALFLIMGVVLVNPFPHTTFKDQVLFYSTFIPMMILVKRQPGYFWWKSPLFHPLLLFFAWSCVSVIFALDKLESARTLYSHLIRYMILYIFIINLFASRKRLVQLATCIVVSELVFALTALIYWYLILDHDLSSRLLITATVVATDIIPFGFITGIYLAGWLFKISENRVTQIYLSLSIFVLLTATIATHSRGALLALCLPLPILFWHHRKLLVTFFIATLCIVAASPMKDRVKPSALFSDNARVGLFFYTFEVIKDYPVSGIGFSLDTFRNPDHIDKETYASRIPEKYRVNPFQRPHNMFLNMAVRTGVIGVIIYGALFAVSIFTSIKLILYGSNRFVQTCARSCLALLAMFLVNGSLQVVTTHFVDTILFVILSLVTIVWKINQDALSTAAGNDK